jgi:hypothetical protein
MGASSGRMIRIRVMVSAITSNQPAIIAIIEMTEPSKTASPFVTSYAESTGWVISIIRGRFNFDR